MTTKERPILFSAPMVRAILDGSKTQTRRIVKDLQGADYDDFASWNRPATTLDAARKHGRFGFTGRIYENGNIGSPFSICCPYGQPGDRLWVREACADIGPRLTYRADADDGAHCMVKRWTPSIHMPRWASRILLEIVSVRVERLQDISESDAMAEGIKGRKVWSDTRIGGHMVYGLGSDNDWCVTPQQAFWELWESINGEESRGANPWVWVVEFKRVLPCK